MILIADSGSTKTDWVILKDGNVIYNCQSNGLNPNFCSDAELFDEVKKSFSGYENINSVAKIFFYGSGCSKTENALRISNVLKKVFLTTQEILVDTDMLGAVRSFDLFDDSIVCILGTGSNACIANKGTIYFQAPSFGYLLGDFGSGCDIGKRTLSAFLEKKFSSNLHKSFQNWINLEDGEIIAEIYNNPRPNRFFASVALFHSYYQTDLFLRGIRRESFNDFFIRQLSLIPDAKKYKAYSVGSVGYSFCEELFAEGERNGFRFEKFIKSPMEGLINYHRNNK